MYTTRSTELGHEGRPYQQVTAKVWEGAGSEVKVQTRARLRRRSGEEKFYQWTRRGEPHWMSGGT